MLTLVVYLPGAGGNHLKNLLCVSTQYANSSDLRPEVYESPDPQRPPGEVWCVGGRNLQEIFFERMLQQPDQNWVLAAHLGEMFQYQTQLQSIACKKIVVLTLEDSSARQQLFQRQCRLGQNIHPYWLDEELLWMYSSSVVSKLFDQQDSYFELSIRDFWHFEFANSQQFANLKNFLNLEVDQATIDRYHRLWCIANSFV